MHRSGTFNVVGTCTDQFFAYKIALKKEYEFNEFKNSEKFSQMYKEIDSIDSVKYFEEFIDTWLKLRTDLNLDYRFVVLASEFFNDKMEIETEISDFEECEEYEDFEIIKNIN